MWSDKGWEQILRRVVWSIFLVGAITGLTVMSIFALLMWWWVL